MIDGHLGDGDEHAVDEAEDGADADGDSDGDDGRQAVVVGRAARR